MQDLTVTLVQADQVWEDKSSNFDRYEHLLSEVESELIILPEMFNTCFSMNTSLAESMDGQSIAWLKKLAKAKDAAVYTSLMIEDHGETFNRGVFVKPNGTIECYDKRKRFGMAKEDLHFSAGNQAIVVDYKSWKINLQICYDLRFPEIVRNELTDGQALYDLILYVANWPEKRSSHWDALLKARAIENQSFVIGVNRVGKDANGFTYSGNSRMIDPLGNVSALPINEELSQNIVIKRRDIESIREMLPFLKDR